MKLVFLLPLVKGLLVHLFFQQTLRILYYNTRSIIPKRAELSALCTAEEPHIVCLTETWLDEDISDHEICFGNYSIVCRDRNGHGGGVAMLIHNSLSYSILVKGTDDLKVIFVSLSCASGKFCLGVFYRPPSSFFSHFLYSRECYF